MKGSNVPVCGVTVWKAAGKGMSVQQRWRESREHLSIFTEQHRFSIWCFSALPLYRALPCNSFVLIPVHCQARNPISVSDLCWQGWGRSWKPFSPWVLSAHPRGEINSFWKHLHPTERSPESWGRWINGGSSRLCSNMGRTSSSKNIAKKILNSDNFRGAGGRQVMFWVVIFHTVHHSPITSAGVFFKQFCLHQVLVTVWPVTCGMCWLRL